MVIHGNWLDHQNQTNFSVSPCRCPIINLQYVFAPSPPSTPFCFSCPLVLVLLSYHLAFTEAERRVSLRFVLKSRSVQNDMHLWDTVEGCASTPHPRDFPTATTFTAILTGTYLRTGAFDRRTLTLACAGFVCTIRSSKSVCLEFLKTDISSSRGAALRCLLRKSPPTRFDPCGQAETKSATLGRELWRQQACSLIARKVRTSWSSPACQASCILSDRSTLAWTRRWHYALLPAFLSGRSWIVQTAVCHGPGRVGMFWP